MTLTRLSDRVALVAGGTRGAGRGIAVELGAAGKSAVIRLAKAQAAELATHGVTALALTPGFLRSESMLEHFGVTSDTWRDAVEKDRHFAASETPAYIGRTGARTTPSTSHGAQPVA